MNKHTGLEVKDILLAGFIIYMDESSNEKRLYRYNNTDKRIEYSDNYFDWKPSNMVLDDFIKNTWIIFKR